MFNLTQKERGAVAVFLIIVLVPMITCAALFVEVSRVKLAQSLVASAGDLALNTVLSRYDEELNEYFGMLAAAQTDNDVLSATEDYFEACLKSQEIDTTYINKYVNSISGLFKNGSDIVDFLDISIPEGTFHVDATTNGSLNNPALIKTQIVDFMKYRSPINLAASLFDNLKKVGKTVEEIPDQTECLEKQQDFYETEENLLDAAYAAYNKMGSYLQLKITKQYVEDMLTSFDEVKNKYALIHRKLVYDLAGTENLPVFSALTISYEKTSTKYSESNQAKFNRVTDQIDSVSIAIQKFVKAGEKLGSVARLSNSVSDTHVTRYYINVVKEFNKNNQYSQFVARANELSEKIAELKNAYANIKPAADGEDRNYYLEKRDEVDTYGKAHIDTHYNSLISQYEELVEEYITKPECPYKYFSLKLPQIYGSVSRLASDLPSSVNATPDGGISRTKADEAVKAVYDELSGYYTKIKDGEKYVDDAIKKLDDMKDYVTSYKSDFNEWKSAAYKSTLDNNKLAEESREDIEDREMDPEIMNNITETGIDTMISRLNNIKSVLGEIKSAVEGLKYNGKKVIDIKNLKDFEKASGVETSKISTKYAEINTYSKSTFSFESKQSTLNITDNNHPDFSNVNTPPLFTWMDQYFVENKGDNKKNYSESSAKDKYNEFKDEKNSLDASDENDNSEKSEATGLSSNEIKDIKNRPSDSKLDTVEIAEKSSDMGGISTFVTNLFGNFGETLSNAGIAVRDSLYTVDYIMSMFTYDTFESEHRLELWCESNPNSNITLTTDFNTSTKTLWENTDLTFKNNKTLTNQMKNSANCYSYGNEVEYILYGGSNTANKAAAYGTIYMLRLALNAGPVFSEYFSNGVVTGIAGSVSAATLGVVPAPLVQFAICLALTITEAAYDLTYLKKGIGIPLLKTGDQLLVSLSNDSIGSPKVATGKDTGIDFPSYLQYSDYLTLFMFIALLNSKTANGIYGRTADVIQANMTKRTGNSGYRMSQAQVYFTLSSDIKVSPLILPVPLIDNNIGDIKNSDGYENFSTSKWNTFSYSVTRGY